ncbi:hypothetical protein P7C73_g4322, partial [Tremellales sp. Uapishka_1]
MSGFFGFDAVLPERRGNRTQFNGFQSSDPEQAFQGLAKAGEQEDLAVYNWGDGGLDDLNDETFGGGDDLGQDFQFGQAPAQVQPVKTKPQGKVASTQSRYKPTKAHDPFAFSEDDFYASRPAAPKSIKPTPTSRPAPVQANASADNLWSKPPAPSPVWGAAPDVSTGRPSSQSSRPPPGKMLTMDEIEAEMTRTTLASQPAPAAAPVPKVLTLAEIEAEMMSSVEPEPLPAPTPPTQSHPSGQASQQALLDSMFPQLGAPTPPPGSTGPNLLSHTPPTSGPSPQEQAAMEALHQRISAKIEAMSRYNNLMGASDKDFITRIQLSQLATSDPYASDFYAQVYSALQRSRMAAAGTLPDGPSVVQVAPGVGFGLGGPNAAGNRFGKMGNATMQKLSSQVKKLVETKNQHQKGMGSAALQGALGRVTRGNAAGPRPVLAVAAASARETKPDTSLNQQSGPTRQPLTKKQVMYALEELFDQVLDLEQMRRQAPVPPAHEADVEDWNTACQAKTEGIWRRLMIMEPLAVSNPHPFISLLNPIKGQRLLPRLLRHLPPQQSLTLLTLLIATYPQLDVIAKPPPPPVADASLLTKADRLHRLQKEAETDNFIHCVIPQVDGILSRCGLGLTAGLLGICNQRMEVWRVACTRPGVALFTTLLSRAQTLLRTPVPDPSNPQIVQGPTADEIDQWNKTYAYFLASILPHFAELFPSTQAQKAAFGPTAYLLNQDKSDSSEIERREAEVWGFAAVLAVNAPEEEQTNLVAALREKILHTVQAARNPATNPQRAELKLRNVNMFLNGLGLDAAMIE